MWAACARKYEWLILPGDKDVSVGRNCKQTQFKTSNEHFVDCKPHEEMPEMPHVKWSSDGGEPRCIRFDNKCKKKIEERLLTNAELPDDWETSMKNKGARVVNFIKLGQ